MPEIVIVDDDPSNLSLFTDILQHDLFVTRPISDPHLAVFSIQDTHPDLIICEVNMRSINGYEVYETLQQNVSTNKIPFIFMTRNENNFTHVMGKAPYAQLKKPVSFTDLFSLVDRLIEKKPLNESVTG